MDGCAVRLCGVDADHPVISALNLRSSNRSSITVWNPDAPYLAEEQTRVVAFLELGDDPSGLAHPRASAHHAVRAQAYAGDRQGIVEAIRWLSRQHTTAPRATGRRVTYLGGLGTRSIDIAIGQSFSLGGELLFGRSKSVHIGIRSGAHSDQNLCARHHARLICDEGGITIEDLKSTNGTYVDGVRINKPTPLTMGQQFALAGYYRFQVE